MSRLRMKVNASDPVNPPTGEFVVYPKADGFYQRGDTGPGEPLGQAAVGAHEAAPDPHPQYTDNAEATTIAQTEAAAAVTAHEALPDPHSQYTTAAEAAAAAPVQTVNAQTGNVNLNAGDVGAEPAGAVATHEAAADPHPGYQLESEKGVANGYASLDGTGKVPIAQIPSLGALLFQGTWNASTNTPTLASGVGTQGHFYIVSVAGSTNLDGITDWEINDWAVFNGTAWVKIDNTDSVTSVNGQTGVVTLTAGDVSADPAGTGASEAAAAVAAHEAAADPHPQYTTTAEAAAAAPVQDVNGQTGNVVLGAGDVGADPAGSAAAAVTAHEGLPDPHPDYQLESEKGAANGYASLDADTKVPFAQLPDKDLIEANGAASTPSGAFVLIPGMTITPPAGTYIVELSLSIGNTTSGDAAEIAIRAGGVVNTNSIRRQDALAFIGGGALSPAHTAAKVTVNGAQAIEGVWREQLGGSATTDFGRTLKYERIA